LLLISGCSGSSEKVETVPAGPVGKVHGKLTLEGKAVPEGTTIYFTALKGGGVARGVADAGGAYSASGVPAGDVSVTVSGPAMKADGSLPELGSTIPEKYGAPATSDAKTVVKADDDVEYNLDLKK
jgi:hypothetical protein